MTLANQITIVRILLIPVFVGCAVYYAQSIRDGMAEPAWRWAAVILFTVAAGSDGIDGYIARRFNQRSRLGTLLDPIADKGLILASILTLSFTPWEWHFPLWFPILVVGRDLLLVAGAFLINHVAGDVVVRPHWTGKVATFFQFCAIGWVMLALQVPHPIVPTALAGIFTLISGLIYLREFLRQLMASEHSRPSPPENPPGA
jgi:CDP-diacylglycerol--glycerol-3-phosphate 3-phosphatidyltransferase/cardiolipin synthase